MVWMYIHLENLAKAAIELKSIVHFLLISTIGRERQNRLIWQNEVFDVVPATLGEEWR